MLSVLPLCSSSHSDRFPNLRLELGLWHCTDGRWWVGGGQVAGRWQRGTWAPGARAVVSKPGELAGASAGREAIGLGRQCLGADAVVLVRCGPALPLRCSGNEESAHLIPMGVVSARGTCSRSSCCKSANTPGVLDSTFQKQETPSTAPAPPFHSTVVKLE